MTSRASRVLLSVVVMLGVCFAPLASAFASAAGSTIDSLPTRAATPAASAASSQVTVAIATIDPLVPSGDEKQQLTLKGTFHNTSTDTTYKDVYVVLKVGQVLHRDNMTTDPPTTYRVYLNAKQPKTIASAAPGADVSWSFPNLTMYDIGLRDNGQPGVYQIDVQVNDGNGAPLGHTSTYLVWKALQASSSKTAPGNKIGVALSWPVIGSPELDGVIVDPHSKAPELIDTALQKDIAKGGRLDTLLDQGKDLGIANLNWVVDPDLFTTVHDMSNFSYRALTGATTSVTATSQDQSDALQWWTKAQADISATNCWQLPYADPDVASLAQADGAGVALLNRAKGLTSPPTNCTSAGNPTLAWPANGLSDAATVNLLHSAEIGNALLAGADSTNVPAGGVKMPNPGGMVTPTGHATVYGSAKANTVSAAVSDPELDKLFTAGAQKSGPDGSAEGLLDGQKWLAQTALIERENPASARIVVATPPRDFVASANLLAAIKAGASAQNSWMQFQSLADVFKANAAGPLATPAHRSNTDADIAKTAVDAAAASDTQIQSVIAIQSSKDRDGAAPLRTVATAWRGSPKQQDAFAKKVDGVVSTLHGLVYILGSRPGDPPRTITLSGKSGKVPVTVINQSGSEVSVYLRATSSNSPHLKVSESSQNVRVDIPASSQQLVSLPVTIAGSGQTVILSLQLYTPPDAAVAPGTAYNPKPFEINVKVSRIGIISLALMFGSAAVIIVAIGLRVLRANRAHHAAGQDTMAS